MRTKNDQISSMDMVWILDEYLLEPIQAKHCGEISVVKTIVVDTLALEPNAIHLGPSLVLLFPSEDS